MLEFIVMMTKTLLSFLWILSHRLPTFYSIFVSSMLLSYFTDERTGLGLSEWDRIWTQVCLSPRLKHSKYITNLLKYLLAKWDEGDIDIWGYWDLIKTSRHLKHDFSWIKPYYNYIWMWINRWAAMY